MTGTSISLPAWNQFMSKVRPDYTVVVAWLDRFSRNFDEGVRIQADLTKRIGIVAILVAIKEDINTTDDRAAGKLLPSITTSVSLIG